MTDIEQDGKNELPEEQPYNYDEATFKHWSQELKIAGDADKDYLDKAEFVAKKFYDERKKSEEGEKKASIFYSTIETLKPNVFWSTPKVDVRPRRKSENPISRLGGQIWERLINYSDEHDQETQQVYEDIVDDFLIVNRGVPWIRLEAEIGQVEHRIALTPEEAQQGISQALGRNLAPEEIQQDEQGLFVIEIGEEINSAKTVLDYIPYPDFRYSISKTKAEIRWRARRIYASRKDLKGICDSEQVDYRDVMLTVSDEAKKTRDKKEQEQQEQYLRAEVWEIHDKDSRNVIFLCDGYKKGPLKIVQDPMQLEDFWCAPMPLQSGHGRTSITAWPEWCQWQDQLAAIDELTDRIDRITDSVRVICAADALFQEQLENILKKDNAMVFIPNFRQWAEKNGFSGVMDFLNIEPLIVARQSLIEMRDKEIQLFYEISGYSDIFRGNSDPRKTASAIHEESTQGSIRLKRKRQAFQRFAKQILRIKAEIIATHYPPQLMKDIAGLDGYGDGVTEQQIDQAIQLIKDKKQRAYVIDIETDSTVIANDEQEQKAAAEFLAAIGPLLQQAQAMAGNVAWAKLAKAFVMLASQRYKCGNALQAEIEGALDAQIQQAIELSKQPPPQNQDPNAAANMLLAQAEMTKAQVSGKKVDTDTQVAIEKIKQEANAKIQELQQNAQVKAAEIQLKQQEVALKAKDLAIKEREVGIKAAQALMDGQKVANDVRFKQMDHDQKMSQAVTEPIKAEVPKPTERPKTRVGRVVRGQDGKAAGIIIDDVDKVE